MRHYNFWKRHIGDTYEFRRPKLFGGVIKSATIRDVKKSGDTNIVYYTGTFTNGETMELTSIEYSAPLENTFYQNVIKRTYSYFAKKAFNGAGGILEYPIDKVLKKDGTIKKVVSNPDYGKVYLVE